MGAVLWAGLLSCLLTSSPPIEIRVVDADRRPVPHAEVRARATVWTENADDKVEHTLQTDGNGAATYQPPDALRSLVLTGSHAEHAATRILWQVSDRRTQLGYPAEVTIPLRKTQRIAGWTKDAAGQPLPGAEVRITAWQHNTLPGTPHVRTEHAVISDARGRWEWRQAPQTRELLQWNFALVVDGRKQRMPSTGKQVQQLRAGTIVHTFIPPKPLPDVSGVVTDAAGQPVAGAQVSTCWRRGRFGWIRDSEPTRTSTAADGSFRFASLKPPTLIQDPNQAGFDLFLAVDAPPFATEIVPVSAPAQPIRVQMRLGRVVAGTVRNKQDQPVSDVEVSTVVDYRSDQTIASARTDDDGRFRLTNLPRSRLLLEVNDPARRHSGLRQVVPEESDQDLRVQVTRPTDVFGSVTAAKSGRAIERFTLIEVFGEHPNHMSAVNASTGAYQHGIRGSQPRRLLCRAPGFQEETSPLIVPDGRAVRVDFELEPVDEMAGTVRDADGSPVSDARIYGVPGDAQYAMFRDGRPEDRFYQPPFHEARSAEDGSFSITAEKGLVALLAVSEHGAAFAGVDADGRKSGPFALLSGPQELVIEPVSRITGVVRGPQTSTVGFSCMPIQTGLVVWRSEAEVAADGSFVFERVPPWPACIGRSLGVNLATQHKITLLPGKETTVQIGGTGRTVTGTIADTEHLPHPLQVRLLRRAPAPPASLKTREELTAWSIEWQSSEEGRRFASLPSSHLSELDEQRSFLFHDVLPGRYLLHFEVQRLLLETMVEVPEGPLDQPFDLGTLVPKPRRKLTNVLLKTAPPLPGKTLEGEDFSLADLRGRFVLLDFWATWCGPCVALTPQLKALHETYATDPRFQLVGVALDAKPEPVRDYVTSRKLPWTQVLLPEKEILEAWGITTIPRLLLIGPGGTVVAEVSREQILFDVQGHLGR